MSEYYLADQKAEERASSRERANGAREPAQAADIKITLLGDFLFPTSEPRGFDPYDSLHGKSPGEAWRNTRERR